MFTKPTTLLALFAVAARVAYANPPACLLAAVSNCPDPSDFNAICSDPSRVTNYINKNCGDNKPVALSAFSDFCKAKGEEVSISTTTSIASTASSTATSSGNDSATTTVLPYGTGVSSGSAPILTGTVASSGFATGVASGSGAVLTATAGAANGTLESTAGTAGPSATGTGATASTTPSTGSAARFSVEVFGLIVVGVVGAVVGL